MPPPPENIQQAVVNPLYTGYPSFSHYTLLGMQVGQLSTAAAIREWLIGMESGLLLPCLAP